MAEINLITYTEKLKINSINGVKYVYDIIRKKDLILQSEELVRQCIIHYLIEKLQISKNLIQVEKGIKVNKLYRRCDILVTDRNNNSILLIECKSAKQKLDQKVFNQIAMYNLPLKVPFLMVSNGNENFFCQIDFEKETFEFIEELPSFENMVEKTKFEKNKL